MLNRLRSRYVWLAVVVLLLVSVAGAQQMQLQRRSTYKLHPGDQLTVQFTYTPDLNQPVTIQPDGYIVLNPTGPVQIGGKTVDQATAIIQQAASARLKDPVVSLVLTDFQKPYIIVSGQVQNPLRYDMREPTTALRAIMMAGGITKTGKEKQVVVFHDMDGDTPQVRVLNLKDVGKDTIFEHDMALSSGDIVFVPRTKVSRVQDVAQLAATFGLYLNAATYLIVR